MNRTKSTIAWVLAVVITLAAAFYQKTTGPTYPKKERVSINNIDYQIKLLTSSSRDKEAKIEFEISDKSVSAGLFYRQYPTSDNWTELRFTRRGDELSAVLPDLPPAGKYEYYVKFFSSGDEIIVCQNRPIIIRFKDAVPNWALIPHIIFIFFAMLVANLTGIFVLFKHPKLKLYLIITFVLLLFGGMIFGPIVQKYAFGDFWTGVPFGWDLTDNKMLIAFVTWSIAVLGNLKKDRPWLALVATIVVLLIFSIPHSMFGSELDPTTGEIIQG
ncbi:MAG: hypothetical protein U9R19_02690 [Bacteroidota bacterium]|nr:hypothetical protein [Bacteroidota bacterium]